MSRTAPASDLTIAEVASLWQTSTKTVRRRIADGTLKAVRIGPRLIRVDRASVEAVRSPLTVVRSR